MYLPVFYILYFQVILFLFIVSTCFLFCLNFCSLPMFNFLFRWEFKFFSLWSSFKMQLKIRRKSESFYVGWDLFSSVLGVRTFWWEGGGWVARNCSRIERIYAELREIIRSLQGSQLRASKIHLRWKSYSWPLYQLFGA